MGWERQRSGFTLIELMVVVSIIAVLAALLIPALGMIKRQMKMATAMNNLRGLYAGIAVYQGDHANEVFPPSLSWMFRPGGTLTGDGTPQLLRDPIAVDNSDERGSNRSPTWGDIEYLLQREQFACNIVYEVSDAPFPHDDWPAAWMAEPWSSGTVPPDATWYDYKREQQLRGNSDINDPLTQGPGQGMPFAKDGFPIIRNFWHHRWTGNPNTDAGYQRVVNLSWNGNAFYSSPYWEYDVNPATFPLP